MSQENKSKTYQLTKAGVIILVLTLVFSILCTTFGIVIIAKRNSGNDNHSGANNNATNNQTPTSTSYTIYSGSSKSIDVTPYKYYILELTPSTSGTYIINLDGAYIDEIETSSGYSTTYTTRSSSSYDYSFSAYLTSGITYEISVYSESYEIYCYTYKN